MSVKCEEHKGPDAAHSLTSIYQLFCVSTPTAEGFSTVCRALADAIPIQERSRHPIKDGFDINFVDSASDAPSAGDLRRGARLFSITRATAECYLPHIARLY